MRGEAIAIAALLGLAAPAAAAPCTVDLIRVPDEVRPVIEEWVGAEPRCAVELAVRVIASDGGYYVLATDRAGRVRERQVPDATTAAVLIASWVADDDTAAAAPVPVTPTWAQKSPPVAPTWAQKNPPVTPAWAAPGAPAQGGPPGMVSPPGQVEPVDGAMPAPGRRPLNRLVGVGVTVHEDGGGLRGDIDLIRKWRLKLGVMAAWSHTENYSQFRNLALDDIVVTGQIANEYRFGRFDARASIGAGLAVTTGTPMDGSGSAETTASPVGDATITAGVRVSARWELRSGVVVTYLPQHVFNGEWYWDRDIIPQLIVGVGYRGE